MLADTDVVDALMLLMQQQHMSSTPTSLELANVMFEGWRSPVFVHISSNYIFMLLNPCMHDKPLPSSSHVLLHDGHRLLLVLLRDGYRLLPLCHLLLRLSCRLGVQCWSVCEGTNSIW